MHRNDIQLPFKRYQIGVVFRGEHPKKGRFREFVQCDVDSIGTRSLTADAECVAVGTTYLLLSPGRASGTLRELWLKVQERWLRLRLAQARRSRGMRIVKDDEPRSPRKSSGKDDPWIH